MAATVDFAFLRGTSIKALLYLRRPDSDLKAQQVSKGELLPRLQLDRLAPQRAFDVWTEPGEGNKPLYGRRIELITGSFRSEKYLSTACFTRLQAGVSPVLSHLRTHSRRSSSSSSSDSTGLRRRLTGSKPSSDDILIMIFQHRPLRSAPDFGSRRPDCSQC